MIGNINSNLNNDFFNFKIRKESNSSLNSNTSNTKTQKTSSDSKQASSNEVLGYKVDKNGYFTEEFNEAAGIPKDIKIHSSTMQSLVSKWTSSKDPLRVFRSIDIAKTIGNAYKVLSQVIGEDILNSKDSFTLNEIANFPQGYKYNEQTMQVMNTYDSLADTDNEMKVMRGDNVINNQRVGMSYLFHYTDEEFLKNKSAADNIFNNLGDFNTTPAKYTNPNGSITKGGLLIALINENIYILDGEASSNGKLLGFDKTMSAQDIKNYNPANDPKAKGEFHISFEPILSEMKKGPNLISKENDNSKKGFDELFENYKDPIAQMFEDIQKFQKEQLKHLEKQRQEQRLAQQRKRLDMKA